MIRLEYKKLSIFLFFAIFIVGLFFPSSSSAWMMGLDAAIVWIVQMLTKLWFFGWVSKYFLTMSSGVLGWVTNPQFITDVGGYTQNTLVREGWQITRDLVNMFFILIMVGIGIATILRVKGYEIKKLLPKAIIIILLINFTPIICGLIIDASNILTNFFLSAGTRGMGKMINDIEAPQNSLLGGVMGFINGFAAGGWEGMALSVFHSIIILSFNLIASFILLALAMLFLMRYVMLWILVILSPLAFFCFILPTTKKIWNMWWEQFIQWCFIGIGASFFLYLTQRILDIIGKGAFIMSPSAAETQMGDKGLVVMFVYFVPLIFLAAGFMATSMFAPAGAKQILGLAKWPMSKKGKETRKKFKGWRQEKARQAVGPKVQKAISKLESYKPDWGQNDAEGTTTGRWTKRQAASAVGLVTKIAAGPAKVAFGEGAAVSGKVTGEAYKKAKEQDMWANSADLKTASAEQKPGILRAMGEKKQIKEAIKQKAVHSDDLTAGFKRAVIMNDKKTTNELNTAMAHDKSAMEKFGKIIEKEAGKDEQGKLNKKDGLDSEDKAEGYKTYQDKVLAGLRTEDDFGKLQMTDELREKLTGIALSFYDTGQRGRAGKVLGRSFTDAVQSEAEERGASWFFEIDENTGRARNPSLPKHFASTGSANLAYSPLPGADTKDEINNFRTASRHWEGEIKTASMEVPERAEKLNNLIKKINTEEKNEANEDLKKILASARVAAERKLQVTPRTIQTEEGKITISKEATEDIKKERDQKPSGEGFGMGRA